MQGAELEPEPGWKVIVEPLSVREQEE
jgi:hypothetical protein